MRRPAGFTLLEVVVALAITATGLVVLQRATADALRARRRLETAVQRQGEVGATLVHLVREVAGAVPGTLRIARSPAVPSTLLEFAIDEPAPEIVRYRVAEHRLERLAVPRFGLHAAGAVPAVLLPDVATFGVRGRDRDGWHDTWEETRLPALLALELGLGSGERLATIVPLLTGGRP